MSHRAPTWIALLRGVNVGGRNRLPMKEFSRELEALGFADVRTYIQSGNVVFRASPHDGSGATLAGSIAAGIHKEFGFLPGVVVLNQEEFARAAAANPFREAEAERDGRALHLFFLSAAPRKIDHAGLDAVKKPSERWRVVGSVFYLHAPEGFGNSKLAAKAEKCLGVPATARNWRTICELLRLAEGLG